MRITKVEETEISESPHKIDVRKLFDKELAEVVHIKLASGESLKPHITPVDVLFYVLKGSPEILIGQQRKTVKSETLIESPKYIPHCIYNNSDEDVRVLVIKIPKPLVKSRLI